MLPPIPLLEEYHISPSHGFLPTEQPLQYLPHPVYDRWERIIANFQSLLLSKRLRVVVDNLPVIPAVHLETEAEWQRAYSMLTLMAHAYIWGGEKPSERLPPSITYPLLQVCDHLDMPPVATYAAVCLWNWKPIFSADTTHLDNLSTLATFTGSLDEQWFYLVSVAIEAKGGPTIPLMLKAIAAAREGDITTVTLCLRSFAETLDDLGSLLVRMYENCDPHVFYHRVRPYLAGSKNMEDAGLPQGVYYDDGSRQTSSWRKYSGGSNAQSSLIQFFDIVLGVEHRPTGTKPDGGAASESEAENGGGIAPKSRHSFIHEMRQYMPGPHRRFLQAVETVANIREFVESNRHDKNLTVSYDACLAMLRALRDKHIQMVSRYIIVKSRESRSRSRSRTHANRTPSPELTRGRGIASVRYTSSQTTPALPTQNHGAPPPPVEKPKKMRGTGGTALVSFLKQARDETGEPAIDHWARKVLTGARRTEADHEIGYQNRLHLMTAQSLGGSDWEFDDDQTGNEGDHHAVDENPVVGLAGTWDMEISGGGLCAY